MKRKLMRNVFVLIVLAATSAFGQEVGTTSLQFLEVMPSARATAMGDAYVSLASGAGSVFWNPAGLTGAEGQQLTSTMTFWLFDTKQVTLAYALPLPNLGVAGVQLEYVDYGSIEETSVDQLQFVGSGNNLQYNPGLTGQTFTPVSYLAGLSFARKFTERFSVGLTAKYAYQSLFNGGTVQVLNPSTGKYDTYKTYASVFLFDFGMHYNTGFRSIELGVAVQNFGSQVTFAQEASPAPLQFRLGADANLIGPEALFAKSNLNRVTLAFDIFQPNDYSQQMHLGVEYSFDNAVALRAGYKFNYQNQGLTLGAGVRVPLAGTHINFDYSYAPMGQFLGHVQRISLGVNFK